MARRVSFKSLIQVASAGKAAVSLAGALLPEDPTWAIAIVGAGLTVGYFLVRSKEVNAVERQETIQDIVSSSAGHFFPREKLADFIRFFLDHPYSGKSLLVAGPKDSGTTLLVCSLLDKSTTPVDHTYGLRHCKERHTLRTSTRVAIRSRCFVGVAGLVSDLKHNFGSTKLEAVISFIQSLFGAFQGGSISMEEMRELRDREHMDFDDPALLHELKTCAKICMSHTIPANHVLFLDNMECHSELAASWPSSGRHTVKVMMDGIKMSAKNCRSQTIICGCTPSYCYDILQSVHFKDYFELCFVGDLSYDNAYQLYHTIVQSSLQPHLQASALKESAFREVYRVVGGRVGDIRAYVLYCGATDEVIPPECLPKVGRQTTRLLQLLACGMSGGGCGGGVDGEGEVPCEVDVKAPRWNARQVASAFSTMLDSGNAFGCVPFQVMAEVVGGCHILRSLLEHDVLLYRPQFALHEDFPPNRYGEYVGPYSPLDFFCICNHLRVKVADVLGSVADEGEA